MLFRCHKFLALLLLGLLVGCSSAAPPKDVATAKQPVANADEQILKSDPVERNYDPHVIMKRAEAFFEKEDFPEAAVEYQHFLDLHRTHTLAPYAQYRLGLSHFSQITTHDRTPEPVRLAIEAFEKLLKNYPGNAYEPNAKEKIKECRAHTAEYELYVGRHYYRQTAYLAAMHRFERVLALYPDLDTSADALYYLAKTYKDLGSLEQAVESLTLLLTRYPQSPIRKEGQTLLAALNGKPVPQSVQQAASTSNGATIMAPPSIPPLLPPTPQTRSLTTTPTDPPLPVIRGTSGATVTCGMNVMC